LLWTSVTFELKKDTTAVIIISPIKMGANPIKLLLIGSVLPISTLPILTVLPCLFGTNSIFPTGTNKIIATRKWDSS
jgi:hypothetical protein